MSRRRQPNLRGIRGLALVLLSAKHVRLLVMVCLLATRIDCFETPVLQRRGCARKCYERCAAGSPSRTGICTLPEVSRCMERHRLEC